MTIGDFDGGVDTSKPAVAVAALPTSTDFDNVNKMGSTNPVQYTEPKPEPNLVQRVGEDVEKPFVQAQHTIGAGISWLGDNLKDETPFGALGDRITRAGLILQERAQASLSKKFSNFTPNIMDGIVGSVPSLAAFIGVASLGATGATAATVGGALTIGAGVAAEDYQKFKAMGRSTPEADAKAAMIGIPTGGVAALGFGIANRLVSPWLGKMLGDTIGKFASLSVQGGTALGAQGVVQGEAENITGAEKKSQIEIMTQAATNAVIGGVLGPAAAMGHVFQWHNQVVEGFKNLGMKPADAQQATTDMLGQASHVVMDKIEQHINPTADELSRVQASPPPPVQPIRPNVLDRSSIPIENEYPSLGQEPLSHEQVTEQSRANEYVKLEPLNLQIKTKTDLATGQEIMDPRATTEDLRYKYTGGRNQQLLRGSYLATDMASKAPEEDQANFWGRNYTKEQLQEIVANPEKVLLDKAKATFERFNPGEKFVVDKEEMAANLVHLKEHLPDIEKAINPSQDALVARSMHERFIDENGRVALSLGTINEIRENYFTNRLWKPDAPNTAPKMEGKAGVKTFSFHKLQRVYEDPLEGIANGKRLATTKLSDLTAVLNQDTTMVNYGRQLVDETSKMDTPLLKWFSKGSTPKDWKEYDGMTKEMPFKDKAGDLQIARYVAASPKEIYHGMRPLVEPDWWRAKVPFVAGIQDIQAYIKTGWLGMSAYHDITFATQTLSSMGGAKTLADLPKAIIDGTMDTPVWRDRESFWVKQGLTTPAMSEVMDIRNELEEKGENWDKFLKTPIIKEVNQLSEAHTKFLFGPYQRWIKVETADKTYNNWVGAHPKASEEELAQAAREIGRATNDTFGGRNWEALGYTKTSLSMLRTFLLAPDWVTSMAGFAKSVLMLPSAEETMSGIQRTPADQAMNRANLFKTLAGGYLLGNGLNMLLAHHPMWQNKKGHQLEVEIAPDVYFAPIRGMVGEMAKMYMQMDEEGALAGAQRYVVNKASPFAGTGLMAATGESPVGGSIWKGDTKLQKQINGAWALIAHNIPLPFNIGGVAKYIASGEASPLGVGGVATGGARFAPQSQANQTHQLNESVIQAYRNGNEEYVKGLIDKGDLSQEEADHLKDESTKTDLERKTEHLKIDKLIELYNKSTPDDRKQIKAGLEDKFDRYMGSSVSPNAKKKVQKLYDNMAKE